MGENRKRIMIAAPKSGSGKTMITCALLKACKELGHQVVSYKCGPDYIDPMFHKTVLGISSGNLDTFFTGEEETEKLFLKGRKKEELAVLEGVMGVYDGLGGIWEEGSSYHLAKVTKTPIILVVDAKGMGRSLLPLIAGFLEYDQDRLIQGVILNRMSPSYYETLKSLIETELTIPVLGFLPERKDLVIESRHLGLRMPQEMEDLQERLEQLAQELCKTVSIEQILKIAEGAQSLSQPEEEQKTVDTEHRPLIAVARDEAFCFYYEENLEVLREKGARIGFFSPLRDKTLPEGSCGLLLGGGYPELYADRLSKNRSMKKAIQNAFQDGMPVVAECGGFLYLHNLLQGYKGQDYEMAGVLPYSCRDTGKLVRFGYVEIEEARNHFLPEGAKIRGHEFHYFDSENNGSDCIAVKPVTGKSYSCIHTTDHYWLGFPHLYYPSNPAFAESFVKKADLFIKKSAE